MATEYLFDAIRATSGEDVVVCAVIADEEGALITDGCYITLLAEEGPVTKIYGTFDGEQWTFVIPGEVTAGKYGRYCYTIGRNFVDITFKSPLYLV